MISNMESLEVLLSLAKTGSVRRTAQDLGMESSSVSKRLAKLERELGRQLFDKTRRPFVMTSDAQAILESVRLICEEKRRIERYYEALQDDSLRIVRMMVGNNQMRIAPRLIGRYAELFPGMRFNLISPPDVDEFLAGKADLINLSGQAEIPAGCVEVPRGRMVFVPVASAQYMREKGPITHPQELSGHRVFSNLYPHRFDFHVEYPLVKNGRCAYFEAIETIRFSNVAMTLEAVLAGEGVAPCMPLALCIDELEKGALVPILNGWHRPANKSVVVCKQDDWKIRHLRTFASWWARECIAHEKACEKRLAALFGAGFVQNLLH